MKYAHNTAALGMIRKSEVEYWNEIKRFFVVSINYGS